MDADEIAQRLFTAIEAGDIDTVRSLYAPDAVVWMNVDGVERTGADSVATLAWVTRTTTGFHYTRIRRSITATGFVQQHVVNLINRAGEEISFPACIVGTVLGDHITRIEEYVDSAAAAGIGAK
ncbi:MAG: nuclear transport factor 2 family protein [Mycobacterium sp.]